MMITQKTLKVGIIVNRYFLDRRMLVTPALLSCQVNKHYVLITVSDHVEQLPLTR